MPTIWLMLIDTAWNRPIFLVSCWTWGLGGSDIGSSKGAGG
jgi:hypothetical protein